MDALTRVTCCFPFQSLTCFWIVSNLIINNGGSCDQSTRGLIIIILAIFGCGVILANFTDTYTATNNVKFVVLLVPCYGPVCLSLPSDLDKDRMYEHFCLKVRDYIRALISLVAFVLIAVFINPISMCLFPGSDASVSRLDPSIIRTVPVVVALVTALMMLCLGPPRQSLGFQNVDETCPPFENQNQMGNNPIYMERSGTEYMGHAPPASIPEGEEEDDFPRLSPNNSMAHGPGNQQWSGGRAAANSMTFSSNNPTSSQQFPKQMMGPPNASMSHSNHTQSSSQHFNKQLSQSRGNPQPVSMSQHSQPPRSMSVRESNRSSQQYE